MGNKDILAPYLTKPDGGKVYTDQNKLKLYHEIWTNIFKISEDENRNFDPINERRVNETLRNNTERIQPYLTSDLSRLLEDDPLLRPMQIADLKRIIKSMKNKAPGKSGIRKNVMEKCPEIALVKFKELINHALSIAYFPEAFKYAIIRLILKEGKDNRNPTNYRPISLLEFPGKIMERLINERLIKFLEDNQKLNNSQYAFRKGRGTQQAIASLYETVAISQREGFRCNVICRDVAKAFDKVWHGGLKYKILQQGLPELYERLLCNFLTNRTAIIRLNNSQSDIIKLQSGVPQGSILSPTLYILFTADLPPPGPWCADISFADDNSQIVIHPGKDREALARCTEREIERINRYEYEWKIKTNPDKFQLISISSTKPKDVIVNGNHIPFKNEAKILGLTLTRQGLKNHVRQRKHQANAQQLKLSRFKKLKPETRPYLFKAMIRPILEYLAILVCITSRSSQIANLKKDTPGQYYAQQNDQREHT